MGHYRETGEDMEMHLVIRRADEEEVTRRLVVRSPEENAAHGPSVGDERLLEEIGIVKTRMHERGAFADRRRSDLLALLELGEESVDIIDIPGLRGEVAHVADRSRLRL